MDKDDPRLCHARQARLEIAELSTARLAVYRMNLYTYAQVFLEDGTKVLAPASTAEAEVREEPSNNDGNTAATALVSKHIAEKARATGIEAAVFDYSGLCYCGHVKALVDAVHETGLKF